MTVEVAVFLGGLGLLVGYRMLTGGINLVGLLSDKSNARTAQSSAGKLSPARAQLLMTTLVGASIWAFGFLKSGNQFPEVPQELLLLLGGSHALYLGSKSGARLLSTSAED
jgi:hypothetical protein